MNTDIVEEHSSELKNEKGTLLVVDGHSLAFRAFLQYLQIIFLLALGKQQIPFGDLLLCFHRL